MLTKVKLGGVILLSTIFALLSVACDDDVDYTVETAAVREALKVQYFDQEAEIDSSMQANIYLEKFGPSTVSIIFNEGPFYNPVQAIDTIHATGGLEIMSTIARFTDKAVDINVNVTNLKQDYAIAFPLSEVQNGQGVASSGILTINLKAR